MNADRAVLTDAMWARTCPMLPGKATDPGAARQITGSYLRQCCGGTAGSPWRDLPEQFGKEAHLQTDPQMGPFGYLRAFCGRVV